MKRNTLKNSNPAVRRGERYLEPSCMVVKVTPLKVLASSIINPEADDNESVNQYDFSW